MSNGAAIALAFISGAFFMILVRLFIYGLGLLTIRKGEILRHKGEEIAKQADDILADLVNIQNKLNGNG